MMHIKMTRAFHPVGEGAFCMETFLVEETKYHFVFDCGSSTRLNLIDGTSAFVIKQIESNLDSGEEIEAIFISHFDREHMNGLGELLKKHPVKKLFLPLLKQESRLFLSLKARIEFGNESEGFIHTLIENPRDLLQADEYNVEQIILVDEVDEEASRAVRDVVDFDEMDGIIASNTLLQCKFGMNIPFWRFVLVNFREENRIQKLVKALQQRELPVPQNDEEVSGLWKAHQREIMEIFMSEILEDFSTNSLVVYSGKAMDEMEVEVQPIQSGKSWGECRTFFCVRSGCMYMGDYNIERKLKWNWLKSLYQKEWNEISIWQLPHHGSSKNFNHEMAVHNAEIYVACAGSNNLFQHPSRSVIKKLELTGKIVYWVNEEVENRVVFLYEFPVAIS